MADIIIGASETRTSPLPLVNSSDTLRLLPGVAVTGLMTRDALLVAVGTFINYGVLSNKYDVLYLGGNRTYNFGTLLAEESPESATSVALAYGPGNSSTLREINNYGLMANLGRGAGAIGIRILDTAARVYNAGTLEAAMAISGTGVLDRLLLNNVGEIRGAISLGAANDELVNGEAGRITGTVRLGDGYNSLSNDGAISGDVIFGNQINTLLNTGLINGAVSLGGGNAYLTNEAGARLLGDLTGTGYAGTILNAGVIGSSTGTRVQFGAGAETFRNRAGGIVLSMLDLGDGVNFLFNEGELSSTVIFGSGSDVMNNTGRVVSATHLGGGDNSLDNSGKMGLLTAGDGRDSVINAGRIGAIDLGGGDDVLDSSPGVVAGSVLAGLGDDRIACGDGPDLIYGDDPASMNPSGGSDLIHAGGGDDLVYGGYGVDTVSGGYGDDVLYGGYGADVVYGNQGDDILYGNQDADWMHGGQGGDLLYGGQGDDILNGGVGDDVLYGNLADDTFVFSAGFGHDTVGDFGNGAGDRIRFQPGTFTDFADVQAHMQQLAGGVLLTTALGETVWIVGATTAGLSPGQFLFG